MRTLDLMMLRLWITVTHPPKRDDRGDVPGWVMITILSAVLVVALIGIAGPKLTSLFDNATSSVGNKTP